MNIRNVFVKMVEQQDDYFRTAESFVENFVDAVEITTGLDHLLVRIMYKDVTAATILDVLALAVPVSTFYSVVGFVEYVESCNLEYLLPELKVDGEFVTTTTITWQCPICLAINKHTPENYISDDAIILTCYACETNVTVEKG